MWSRSLVGQPTTFEPTSLSFSTWIRRWRLVRSGSRIGWRRLVTASMPAPGPSSSTWRLAILIGISSWMRACREPKSATGFSSVCGRCWRRRRSSRLSRRSRECRGRQWSRECLGRLAQCHRDPDVQVIADVVDGSVSAGSAAGVVSPVTEQGVWAELVGQEVAVETLRRAVSGEPHAMSHAWLFTGPPGSGRSNAGRAFAAALQCSRGGCGCCTDCRSALNGSHPDVTLVRTEQLSIGVEEVRELVRRAAMSPTLGRYQVIVVEDADRVTERGADALLKSVEEPAARTVWILCAPTPDDVVATIRSRCRLLNLQTPSEEAIAALLQSRDKIDPALARYAARVAQGHIGRALVLARDEGARQRRARILQIPLSLNGLGACLSAAAELVAACTEEAATAAVDAKERSELEEALGFGTRGAKPRQAQAAVKDLEDQQRARAKRFQRDAIDRALTELTGCYRDVLSIQTDSGAMLVNSDLEPQIAVLARRSTPEATLRRIDTLLACRVALEGNVAPLLAVEAALIGLVEA